MRIAFTGVPSCGKTTILNKLKELPEFKDYYTPPSVGRTLNDLNLPINENGNLTTQVGAISLHLLNMEKYENILHERCIVDPLIFGLVDGCLTDEQNSVFFELVKFNLKIRPSYDKIIYLPPIKKFTPDGIRTQNMRYVRNLELMFKKTYEELDLDPKMFKIVQEYGITERFEEVLEFIKL